MTHFEAFRVIVSTVMGVSFAVWYGWCLKTMFLHCERPRDFFSSEEYSTSDVFTFVNVVALGVGLTHLLVLATN